MFLVRDLPLGLTNWAHLKHSVLDFTLVIILLNCWLGIDDLFNFLVPSIHKLFEEIILLQLITQEFHFPLSWPIPILWSSNELLKHIDIEMKLLYSLKPSCYFIKILL